MSSNDNFDYEKALVRNWAMLNSIKINKKKKRCSANKIIADAKKIAAFYEGKTEVEIFLLDFEKKEK